MKLVSWNVNGVRAVMGKEFLQSFEDMNADVMCLQETKAQDDQVSEALAPLEGWFIYSNSAEKKGYSGTAILSRQEPLAVTKNMGIEEHDQEGRVLCAEYEDFYLVTVYTPNSADGLKRLEYRQRWDADFLNYIKGLEVTKPVVVCGDLNVAHREIDIARPKSNYNKSPGYTQAEIDGFDNLVNAGFIDTFRQLHPTEVKYSWWSYRAGARAKNVGWRIDYFLTSSAMIDRIVDAEIYNQYHGSDHCPISITLGF
jgi:exodeoxyribonuclease-3